MGRRGSVYSYEEVSERKYYVFMLIRSNIQGCWFLVWLSLVICFLLVFLHSKQDYAASFKLVHSWVEKCIHGWRIVWEWLLACIKSPITKCSCPKSLWISSNGVAAGFYPIGPKVRIKAGRLKVAKIYICSSQKACMPITVSCCRTAVFGFILELGEEIVVFLL